MKVKFNGEMSEVLALIGGSPQGTLIGQTEYLIQSNDNADIVSPEDRYKYIDDLSVLTLVCLSGLVTEYNFHEHVASDVGTNQLYLSSNTYTMQEKLTFISNWTDENLMKLNERKCNYMIFSNSEIEFATRLSVKNSKIDQLKET